jgi:hypothetical protein
LNAKAKRVIVGLEPEAYTVGRWEKTMGKRRLTRSEWQIGKLAIEADWIVGVKIAV